MSGESEIRLYTLLARISVGRVIPSAKEAIIKFRKSVPELIQKYRKKEMRHIPYSTYLHRQYTDSR